MAIRSIHLVPQCFAREWIFANEKFAQFFVDYDRGLFLKWSIQSEEVAVGLDAQVNRFVWIRLLPARLVAIGPWPQVVVDIQRIDLRLMAHTCLSLVVPLEFGQFKIRDFETTRLFLEIFVGLQEPAAGAGAR